MSILTWIPVKDTSNSFYAYYLYRSNSSNSPNGPYTILDSTLTINQSTFKDKTAKANKHILLLSKTNSACNHAYFSSSSDTLCSMLVTVVNPKNGTAVIKWNSLHNPHLQTSYPTYDLWREFPKGNWMKIAISSKFCLRIPIFILIQFLPVIHLLITVSSLMILPVALLFQLSMEPFSRINPSQTRL